MKKFLRCYPFSDPGVRLVEGFSTYDGNLGDTPGSSHKGIDYVLRKGGRFAGFDVFAMHDGDAYQGISKSWGKFVALRVVAGRTVFTTVYAHLRLVAPHIPLRRDKTNGLTAVVQAGDLLGRAGTTGTTRRIVQLHLELHETDTKNDWKKIDPYGVNDRQSSGKYPQPGALLAGLPHFWISDDPPLAQGR